MLTRALLPVHHSSVVGIPATGFDSLEPRRTAASKRLFLCVCMALPLWVGRAGSLRARRFPWSGLSTRMVPPTPFDSGMAEIQTATKEHVMTKTAIRRTPKKPPVLRVLPTPSAPIPQCQAVADGLTRLKNEALHGMHVGALLMVVHPDGTSTWAAYGTLGEHDNKTAMASSGLTAAVYETCWKGV